MYRENLFEMVFGKSGLSNKEITEVVIQKNFLNTLFGADALFIKIYEEIVGSAASYKMAQDAYDLLAGVHPSFFKNAYTPTSRLNTMQNFLSIGETDTDLMKTFTAKPEINRMGSKARKVKAVFSYICENILTAEAVTAIEDYYKDGENKSFTLAENLTVSINKYQCVAILLSGVKSKDYEEYKMVQLSEKQAYIINRRLNIYFNFTLKEIRELKDDVYSVDKICELSDQLYEKEITYEDINLKLVYVSMLSALAFQDAYLAHKICILLKYYKKAVLRKALTITN